MKHSPSGAQTPSGRRVGRSRTNTVHSLQQQQQQDRYTTEEDYPSSQRSPMIELPAREGIQAELSSRSSSLPVLSRASTFEGPMQLQSSYGGGARSPQPQTLGSGRYANNNNNNNYFSYYADSDDAEPFADQPQHYGGGVSPPASSSAGTTSLANKKGPPPPPPSRAKKPPPPPPPVKRSSANSLYTVS